MQTDAREIKLGALKIQGLKGKYDSRGFVYNFNFIFWI